MTEERVILVEWEDSGLSHGWQSGENIATSKHLCLSVGFVCKDDEAELVIANSHDLGGEESESGAPWGCTIAIPRSAIRHVWELRREQS